MRRTRLLGLCFVALLAFGAAAASSAYAGEYGVCVKAAKGSKGNWKDKGCEKEYTPERGAYDWYPGRTGIGLKGVTKEDFEFTSKDKAAKLALVNAAGAVTDEITCKKSIDAGEILGSQYNWETILLEDCVLKSKKVECRAWTNSQRIQNFPGILLYTDTYLIDHGTLGPLGLQPKELEVWNAYFYSNPYPAGYPYGLPPATLPAGAIPYEAPYIAEADCGGVYIRIRGSVSGVVTPVSKMTSKWNVEFGRGVGEQGLQIERSFGGVEWITESLVFTDTLQNTTRDKSKIEIKDCNEPNAINEEQGALPCQVEELPLPWGPKGT
jgi:hypothetical protein